MGGSRGWSYNIHPKKKKDENEKETNIWGEEVDAEKDIPNKKPTEDEKKLAQIYQDMRIATMRLEELIENAVTLSAKDLHRLDKSVVVQKVAYKLIKNILTKKGFSQLKRTAFQNVDDFQNAENRLVN